MTFPPDSKGKALISARRKIQETLLPVSPVQKGGAIPGYQRADQVRHVARAVKNRPQNQKSCITLVAKSDHAMKTKSLICHPAVLSGPILSVLVFSLVASSPSTAAPDATAAEPKTHTLFMGADLDLKVATDLCRVRDVDGVAFVVCGNGAEHLVPMKKVLIDL